MFKLNPTAAIREHRYSRDLWLLGFYMDEKSEIRSISPPHNYFNYWFSSTDRHNELRREAMHECINREILRRMLALGIVRVFLPQVATVKPCNVPSIPILATRQKDMRRMKRITVVVNADTQDLGVWAYRIISGDGGLEAGSVVSFARALHERGAQAPRPTPTPLASNGSEPGLENETPMLVAKNMPFRVPLDWQTQGLIVLNPGQRLFSWRGDRSMTMQSWNSQPRDLVGSQPPTVQPLVNEIQGHRSAYEHVTSTFDAILDDPKWVAPEADIYLVGIGNGGDALLRALNKKWKDCSHRIAAIALTDPTPIQDRFVDRDFACFLRHRARAYVPSSEPAGTLLAESSSANAALPAHSPDWGYLYFPILSSSEPTFGEVIFPTIHHTILDWFDAVAMFADCGKPYPWVHRVTPDGHEACA